MIYLREFANYTVNSILLIVDVQKSFRRFFSEMYLNQLKKHCMKFSTVYQIFDNHVDGQNVDKDYLYDENAIITVHKDLYNFPNQKDIIEKRYNYNVDADYYKKILDKKVYDDISAKEDNKSLKKGDMFPTKGGTIIVYIGNHHKWFHVPKKLYELLKVNKGNLINIVGGSDSECLEDIYIACKSIGVNVKRDHRFIYSASHCPII